MTRRYFIHHIGLLAAAMLIAACTPTVKDAKPAGKTPDIYPDYKGVTVPVEIAPLNFNMLGDADVVDVVARGSKGGEIHSSGDYAHFDIDEWHRLTRLNIGGTISFTVCVRNDGQWTAYDDFPVYVSQYPLEEYGLTYRRIEPGYESGGDIGIYQRDIQTFDEYPLIQWKAVPGRCFNCHTPNRTDPSMYTMQVRGENGATLLVRDGKQRWLNTATDSTKSAGSYAYWHPSGNYVAYAANRVYQSFFVGTYKPIEVFHTFSNIIVLDTRTNQLLLDPRLMTSSSLEIFPAFSPDGKTLYYSTSESCRLPDEYEKVKCSIVSIPFDAENGTFGESVDTLLNGPATNMSYVMARPSYDGKWLMYVRCSRSNFPIVQRDADLWMMDLSTMSTRRLDELNSAETESYPNWSDNSHWIVFASKRQDGMYTRLYLACIDDKGNASKPFLLPQRNPRKYYDELFDTYNTPDFTKTKVDFDIRGAQEALLSTDRVQVTIR